MSDLDYFINPPWVESAVKINAAALPPELLMKTAVDLAAASAANSGGPFGAVLADPQGNIIEIGWNYVVQAHNSMLHAEAHCIRRAQRMLRTHDLGAPGLPEFRLFSSCAPCVQCFGAIYWSGLKQIFAAAGKEEAEAAGFDEGPLTPDMWAVAREKKGICYVPNFYRNDAALEPFRVFAAARGTLY